MRKLKVGDKVKILVAHCTPKIVGEIATITEITPDNRIFTNLSPFSWTDENSFELIQSNNLGEFYYPIVRDFASDIREINIGINPRFNDLVRNYEEIILNNFIGIPYGISLVDKLFKLQNLTVNKKSMIKKLSNFITKTVDSKTQDRLKAGLINGDLEPTEKGWELLREILWFSNLDAIDAKAKEIIAEQEEQKKA